MGLGNRCEDAGAHTFERANDARQIVQSPELLLTLSRTGVIRLDRFGVIP